MGTIADAEREAARTAWERWAAAEQHFNAAEAALAVESALAALDAGARPWVAGLAARQRVRGLTAGERASALRGLEIARLILRDLDQVQPSGGLTAEALVEVRESYLKHATVLEMLLAGTLPRRSQPPTTLAAEPPREAGRAPEPAPRPQRPPPGPSLREFLAERSILVVSYTGAFLLIVATILFELYGVSGFGGGARFGGVLALDLVLGAAGWACFRIPSLRIVGRTYLAIFALIVPLVGVAAYVFLELKRAGINVDVALSVTAFSCAVLYGALALRLQSQGYAVLALLALPFLWFGVSDANGTLAWQGPAMASLVAVYALAGRPNSRLGGVFSRFVPWFVQGSVGLAAAFTLLRLADADFPSGLWPLALAAAVAAFGLALNAALAGASAAGVARVLQLVSATSALCGLGLAWTVAAYALLQNGWWGPAVAPLALAYTLVEARRLPLPAVDAFAAYARWLRYGATGVSLVASLVVVDIVAQPAGARFPALTLAVAAAVFYAAARLRDGGVEAALALAAGGLAWSATVYALELGGWSAAALAPLVAVLAALDVGVGRWRALRALRTAAAPWIGYCAVAATAAWVPYDWWLVPGSEERAHQAALAFAVIAAAYASHAAAAGKRVSAALALASAGGVYVGLVGPVPLSTGLKPALMTPLVALYAIVAWRGHRAGTAGVPFAAVGKPFVHVAAGLVAFLTVAMFVYFEIAADFGGDVAVKTAPELAAGTASLGAAYSLYCWLSGRLNATWTVALAATASALLLGFGLRWGEVGAAVELTLLAYLYAGSGRLLKAFPVRHFFRTGAAVQVALVLTLNVSPPWVEAVALVAGAALLALVAVEVSSAYWLYLFTPVFAGAWYWILVAIFGVPPNPRPADLALGFSPLPVLYALAGLVLRGLTRRRFWPLPMHLSAAGLGIFVIGLAIFSPDERLAAWLLLGYAAAAYAVAVVERAAPVVPVAALAAFTGTALLLQLADSAPYWYPLVAAAFAAGAFGGRLAWGRTSIGGRYWIEVHRVLGLTGGAVAALSYLFLPDFWAPRSPGSLTALAALLALALMLYVDARLARLALMEYASALATALGGVWLARYAGADNPESYVALPGLALILGGLRLPHDSRVSRAREIGMASVGAGCALLLGTTAIQALAVSWTYTALTLVEAVAAIVLGLAARSRVLVLAGAAAVAATSIWALYQLVAAGVQLYIVFGALALLLLVAAAALALLRDRFATARAGLAQSWRSWN